MEHWKGIELAQSCESEKLVSGLISSLTQAEALATQRQLVQMYTG